RAIRFLEEPVRSGLGASGVGVVGVSNAGSRVGGGAVAGPVVTVMLPPGAGRGVPGPAAGTAGMGGGTARLPMRDLVVVTGGRAAVRSIQRPSVSSSG